MNCLWCDQDMIPEISWENIFILSKPSELCDSCEKELDILHGDRCEQCSCLSEKSVCSDCKWWNEQLEWRDSLTFNYSVYSYSEQMKAMVSKWKYRGDYILANAFKSLFVSSFKRKFSFLSKRALIVPIPLSEERLTDRGFNQAKILADYLPMEGREVITRIHSEKQAKKTRYERISTSNPFKVKENVNKAVILVDDIYTTGTTLRHAATLLKANGCPNVYAYTLIRG